MGQSKLMVNVLDSMDLPEDIVYEGKIKKALGFTDKNGENIVILSETGLYQNDKFTHENDGQDAELYAYQFLRANGTFQQNWKVYDFVQDCPLDIEANFIKEAFQVTDLNKDGLAEIWIMYRTCCRGDVSPSDMKIIMYQGKQKYAMRGKSKVALSKKEFYGGEYTFDKAFTQGPLKFRHFAEKLWNKNIMQTWGE